MNATCLVALQAIERELGTGSLLDFQKDPFGTFCRFCQWCLTNPVHGAIKHVTTSDDLRGEFGKVEALCAEQNRDQAAWKARMEPIMIIAMGDCGGNEARAADVAYGIARTIGDANASFAGTMIRKMLRLTAAAVLFAKLHELTQTN